MPGKEELPRPALGQLQRVIFRGCFNLYCKTRVPSGQLWQQPAGPSARAESRPSARSLRSQGMPEPLASSAGDEELVLPSGPC